MDLNIILWIPGMEYFKFCFEHVYDLSSVHLFIDMSYISMVYKDTFMDKISMELYDFGSIELSV